ncbi:helix-turn-helix domain-containing protein [Iocasia frigidifontis]|uniref:Helix-turn-helix domain-containing protein n=1 Tax=Iocasia fonsfrigidae TaxID=2682810 RepID=A0A8A7KAU6_9FIRM|nr:XRE family transcriptional regulator [Iocasia fonsfrigidae]QTL98953.1 helix-turn-helix domain-containing protein [Iocasia fonsfrigidae]
MNIAKIIGYNLRKVQEENNYSQKELGEIIDVTRQTISKYLNGERILDCGKLYKLAKHFNKSIDYFLSQDNNEDDMAFMFRADDLENNFNKILKEQISQRFNYYHEVIEMSDLQIKDYIPEEYNIEIKGDKLSKKEKETIAKIAEKQRRYMGVDDALNVNIFNLFEENNINIMAQEIYDQNLDALSAYSKDKGAFIFINDRKDIPEERKIFSVVHELGHLILHREEYSKDVSQLKYTNSGIKDIREKVADYFAMSFLIPAKVLESYSYYFDGYVDLDLIIEKKKDFGVSAKSLIMALKENGLIDGPTLGALFKFLRKRGFETAEPNPREYIKKNEKLLALVRKLVIEKKITINKAAVVLNIPVSEMRRKAKRWKNSGYNKT